MKVIGKNKNTVKEKQAHEVNRRCVNIIFLSNQFNPFKVTRENTDTEP